MANTLCLGGFQVLSENELIMVDGGWSWKNFGRATLGGAVSGAMYSAATPPFAPIDIASGALVGAALYCVSQF